MFILKLIKLIKRLGSKVEQCNMILCVLTRKLDILCNREFKLNTRHPTMQNRIEFLEARALALKNAG